MKNTIKITAEGTILKQPVSTAFTYESSATYTGYSGEIVVEKGISLKDLFAYLNGDESATIISNNERLVLRIEGWNNKKYQEQISIIEGIISEISLRIINFEKKEKTGKIAQKSSIFSIILPKITIDEIPGLPINGFKPFELTFEVIRASAAADITTNDGKVIKISKGFSFILKANIPGVFSETLAYPPTSNSTTDLIPVRARGIEVEEEKEEKQEKGLKWFELNKKWGPVNLKRIGLQYADRKESLLKELIKTKLKKGTKVEPQKIRYYKNELIAKPFRKYKVISIAFDADFNLSALEITIQGLKLGIKPTWPLKKPEFGLSGLGILFQTSTITIGGLLVKKEDTELLKNNYLGAVIIKVGKVNIFAVGGYASYKNKTSLFVYGYLGIPVEGGSPFVVQGIALGFGYNRDVVLPTIDKVNTFPLVEQAMGNTKPNDNGENFLGRLITELTTAFPPKENSIFIAIGIKFNSYRIIDGFALVFLVFGDKFKFYIIGVATISLTPDLKEPLIFIEIAIKLTLVPEDGIFALDGLITNRSYILSKDVKLTGGFAMYFWFGNSPYKGDFVVTFGGYHKKFNVPAHYPNTPRVQLSWVVSDKLKIKAEAYFALTPVALMAGGMLSAVFNSSVLYASFKFYADFLIQWKPVYYDIHVGIEIHIKITVKVGKGWFSVSKTVSFDLEIELHIWGPEFSGYGKIKFKVLGVKFSVGLSFGSNSSSPPPLKWSEFKTHFLPANLAEKLSILVAKGLLKTNKERTISFVNPNALELRFETGIPVNKVILNGVEQTLGSVPIFGVFPTIYRSIESSLEITLTNISNKKIDVEILKENFPKSLWGNDRTINLSDKNTLIKEVTSGIKITLKLNETQKVDFDSTGFDEANLVFEADKNSFDYEGILSDYKNVLEEDNNHIDIYNEAFLRAKPALFF